MIILANIWPTWVTKESLVNAGMRVGITSTALSIGFMQQDKFELAEACIHETNSENLCSSLTVMSPIVSPDKRKGSAECGKAKYEHEMSINQ